VVRGSLKHVLFSLHPVNVLSRGKIQLVSSLGALIERLYLIISDEGLLDDLHRVDPPRLLQLDHQHLGVAAPSNYANQFKIVERVLALGARF
jgi:hypothetical protein